jgi:hypothetical protein
VQTPQTSAASGAGASISGPAPRPTSNLDLVNAYYYFAHSADQAGYYFTTPSRRWRCAILPHSKAGCQPGSANAAIGISGAPTSVPDAQGDSNAPNAILVDRTGDAQFARLGQSEFALVPGPANVLPFNKVLAAAGFRCNVQESSGVSCLNESTGKGFTFSTDGYALQYTDLPG